jgi:predicted dehydrogenase
MTRLRTAVFGGGLIAQIEHVPNLLSLREKFEVVRLADPSATARNFIEERFGIPTRETLDQLLDDRLDAIVICSPDFTHKQAVLAALARGLHVFCEKPLCYGAAEADEIIAARDKAGKVVQVGYMKRFDRSYEAALDALPGNGSSLRYVSVEVNEADFPHHIAHHESRKAADLPAALIAAGRAETERQVTAALGHRLDSLTFRGFVTAYSSSLVHDVNAVHGLLDALGAADGEVIGASVFAGGDGGSGTVRLEGGRAEWHMVHLMAPNLADYRERIALYFDDWLLELLFPSPYLNNQQTELIIHRTEGDRHERTLVRSGFEEAYVRELKGFWSAVVNGEPVRNTVEHARRDQALLCEMGRRASRDVRA